MQLRYRGIPHESAALGSTARRMPACFRYRGVAYRSEPGPVDAAATPAGRRMYRGFPH